MAKDRHMVLSRKSWTDPEPETLDVGLESSNDTSEVFCVFTTSYTWLDKKQTTQVYEHLSEILKSWDLMQEVANSKNNDD